MKNLPASCGSRERRDILFLALFVITAFLLGGGARSDIQSLIILRPIAVLVCTYALVGMCWPKGGLGWVALVLALGWISLSLIHLLPLPPSIWQVLPGHEPLARADDAGGLNGTWRPIAIAPNAAWNGFYALFVPLAVLLLGIRCRNEDVRRLLPILIVLAIASALLGLLQVSSISGSGFYFYQIYSRGMPTGLFANRNHAAVLIACCFPMLATYAGTAKSEKQARLRSWGGVIAAVPLIPLVLIVGSRAGLVLSGLGVLSSFALYRGPHELMRRKRPPRQVSQFVLLGSLSLSLVALTALLSRAVAINRILAADPADDLRVAIWKASWPLVSKYLPLGSGIGTYVEAYQISEPVHMIGPSYINHAHNDYLELLITTGIPGAALALIAIAALVGYSMAAWRRPVRGDAEQFARLGVVVCGILLLASFADYPLRTPSLSTLFVVGLLWLMAAATDTGQSASGRGRSLQ